MWLSVVVPVYNEHTAIDAFLREAARHREAVAEFVFVDDGSGDGSAEALRKGVQELGLTARVLVLVNNVGKDRAVLAAFDHVRGDTVAVMDIDLQFSFPDMLAMARRLFERDADVVIGLRHGYLSVSNVLMRVLSVVSGAKRYANLSDSFVVRRRTLAPLLAAHAISPVFSLRGILLDLSPRTEFVDITMAARRSGRSRMTLGKLIDIFISTVLLGFPNLARLSFVGAAAFCAFAVFYAAWVIYRTLLGRAPGGFPSLMIVQLIAFSFLFLVVGVVSEYVNALLKCVVVRKPYVSVRDVFEHGDDLSDLPPPR